MAIYKLSRTADTDFESIFIYGVLTFGLQQADSYAQGMQARFEQLAQKPYLYPAIDHIRQGYRLSVYHSHSIYYYIDSDSVVIGRILRSQDVGRALAEEHD